MNTANMRAQTGDVDAAAERDARARDVTFTQGQAAMASVVVGQWKDGAPLEVVHGFTCLYCRRFSFFFHSDCHRKKIPSVGHTA